MPSLAEWLFVFALLFSGGASAADPSATLSRGVNITGWFRFPVSRDPAVLSNYMSDQALADLRAAGFDFVRLPVDPAVVATPAARLILVNAIRRIQRQQLTVIVSVHPVDWRLETEPADRERLIDFWRTLAPALRPLDPAHTVPEVLNEPVFPGNPAAWANLQHQALAVIRRALPDVTVVLTGHDWGCIKGLLSLTPEPDPNVLYSFHFYDPVELTALAPYRQGLDRAALARLPFPEDSRTDCETISDAARDPATRDLMHFYCKLGWDQEKVTQEIDAAASWANEHHVRLIAGEFGATAQLNPAARRAWLQTIRSTLAARGIPWALWGYDDVMGFAVARPPGPHPLLNPEVLSALGMTRGAASLPDASLIRLARHDQQP
jgi:hypothetical protein